MQHIFQYTNKYVYKDNNEIYKSKNIIRNMYMK